jgi:MFS family permease
MPYPMLLRSVVRIVRDEPVLRLRMLYGGLCFASFGAFWTSAGFMLAGAPYNWSTPAIGAFALVGAAGAFAARFAGQLADKGRVHLATVGFLLAMTLSYGLIALGKGWLPALILGVAVMDLGCQGVHISNQSIIYALRPEARSRINTAYMTFYFLSGSIGSGLSAALYPLFGWAGVCVIGFAFPAIGTAVWLVESRKKSPRIAPVGV